MSAMIVKKAQGNKELISQIDLDLLKDGSFNEARLELLHESHPLGYGLTHDEVKDARAMILEFKEELSWREMPELSIAPEEYQAFDLAYAWNTRNSMRKILETCPKGFKDLIPSLLLEKLTPPPVKALRTSSSLSSNKGRENKVLHS
jgi:hypothetical protein